MEETHPLIQEIFQPLLGQYGKYIEFKKFDAAAELKKVSSHFKSESTEDLKLGTSWHVWLQKLCNLLWAVWGLT